jgi:formylglycine-generating enzyme required for sulfatase activity
MKTITIIFSLLILTPNLIAQIEQGDMSLEDKPIFLPKELAVSRQTGDGRFCAALKIVSNLDNFSYDSEMRVIYYDDKPHEDIIFLDPNDRFITLYHIGYKPLKIIFSEHGILLGQKQIWQLRITASEVNTLPVSFVLTPQDAQITIDGNNMGSGPTFPLNTGTHVIGISKPQHYPKQDTITITPDSVIFHYNLAKKPDMVLVDGGTFDMGDTFGDGGNNEKPVHRVTLNSFFIGKYEVTFNEYDVFCIATGRELPGDCLWGRENRPVINVSWYDAVEFCNWLSWQEGLTPCYTIDKTRQDPNNTNTNDDVKWRVSCDFTADGYRLPTEAEWEYACKGGARSAGYKYSGSSSVDEVAWFNDNAADKTHPVGTKKANELGIYDMSGNIFEWCWDWYEEDYYRNSPSQHPTDPDGGSYRVIRGGAWQNSARYVHCAGRHKNWASSHVDNVGFRLCRTM